MAAPIFSRSYLSASTKRPWPATANQVDVLTQRVEKLQQIYSVGKYASRFIKATKCALSIKGICSDHMAEPFNHFLPPQRARVQEILERL